MSRICSNEASSNLKDWQRSKKLLCIRLDYMGDVLMTSPALRAIKESAPIRTVTLLTSKNGAEVANLMPFIDDIIVYDAPWMKLSRTENFSDDVVLINKLRAGRFDAAVIFTVYTQSPLPSALLCYLANIPLRLAHCRENPYSLLTDWVPDPEPAYVRHEVQRQLDLVKVIDAYTEDEHLSLRISSYARGHIDALLQRLCLDEQDQWIILHAGATAASRRFPKERFALVVRELTRLGYTILFTGVMSELELTEQIREEAGVSSHSLVGRLDLASLGALLERAPLLISNNTGIVHVAAALGTPTLDLYALTNPQHTPWMVPHRVLYHDVPCKFCYQSSCPELHHNCLRLVTVESIVQTALELLSRQEIMLEPEKAFLFPD